MQSSLDASSAEREEMLALLAVPPTVRRLQPVVQHRPVAVETRRAPQQQPQAEARDRGCQHHLSRWGALTGNGAMQEVAWLESP